MSFYWVSKAGPRSEWRRGLQGFSAMERLQPDVVSFNAAISCCAWPMAKHLLNTMQLADVVSFLVEVWRFGCYVPDGWRTKNWWSMMIPQIRSESLRPVSQGFSACLLSITDWPKALGLFGWMKEQVETNVSRRNLDGWTGPAIPMMFQDFWAWQHLLLIFLKMMFLHVFAWFRKQLNCRLTGAETYLRCDKPFESRSDLRCTVTMPWSVLARTDCSGN